MVNRQYWAATNPHDGSPDMSQALYVRLATPADEAAWRRDGSPTVWKSVGQSVGLAQPTSVSEAWMLPLSAARGKLTALSAAYGSQQFFVGDKAFSLKQLRALPVNPGPGQDPAPGGLVAFGLEGQRDVLPLPDGSRGPRDPPATPAVRAALYTLLAGLPGVRSLGAVTDVAGQAGVAVAHTEKYSRCGSQIDLTSSGSGGGALFSSCTVQQILIIGPDDGMPLAAELRYVSLPPGRHWPVPDGLFSYEARRSPTGPAATRRAASRAGLVSAAGRGGQRDAGQPLRLGPEPAGHRGVPRLPGRPDGGAGPTISKPFGP